MHVVEAECFGLTKAIQTFFSRISGQRITPFVMAESWASNQKYRLILGICRLQIIFSKWLYSTPPHFKNLGKGSWMGKKYGTLLPTWETDIKAGFDECMRVLHVHGTLIFKWNESQITIKKIIEVIGVQPLFGHTTKKSGNTIWMAFIKK